MVKKHTVGGSVEQLPNTCQVGNKTIGDLALVITVMITLISKSNSKLAEVHFQGAGNIFQNKIVSLTGDYIVFRFS